MGSGFGFHKGIPLAAVGAAPQPFQALLATLLTDEDSARFIHFTHGITLPHLNRQSNNPLGLERAYLGWSKIAS